MESRIDILITSSLSLAFIKKFEAFIYSCPDATPFYMGLDTQGRIVCKALSNSPCGDGNYLVSIDPDTLTPNCSPIGNVVSCPYGEKITSFNWVGGITVNRSCAARTVPALNALTTATTTTTTTTPTTLTVTTTTLIAWAPTPTTMPMVTTTTMEMATTTTVYASNPADECAAIDGVWAGGLCCAPGTGPSSSPPQACMPPQ